MSRVCSIDGCERPHSGKGFCKRHYLRLHRHGDPLAGGPERIVGDDEARFWSKVEKTSDCWIWHGPRNELGYGSIGIGGARGRHVKAHRFAYESVVGLIPEGLELDHL